MNKTLIAVAALSALTTTATIAGPHCGQARTADKYEPMARPAVMNNQSAYSPYQYGNERYNMHRVGGYGSSYGKSSYGNPAAKNLKPDIVDRFNNYCSHS